MSSFRTGSERILLVAKYHIKPGQMETVLAALKRMAALVRRHEAGCLEYRANISTEHPDLILLYEEYANQPAFTAHRETTHFREIIEGTIVPLLERRERELYAPFAL